MDQLINIVLTAFITGAVSSVATVGALKVHIAYLRESVADLKAAVTRAHERIDTLEKCSYQKGEKAA